MSFYSQPVFDAPLEKLEHYKSLLNQWHPVQCEGSVFRIDKFGCWYFNESRINRPEMVALFSSLLIKEGDAFFIVSPIEKIRVIVEGFPLTIHHYTLLTDSIRFETTVGDIIAFDGSLPFCLLDDEPFIEVREGIMARLARSVYYQLMALSECEERENGIQVTIALADKVIRII